VKQEKEVTVTDTKTTAATKKEKAMKKDATKTAHATKTATTEATGEVTAAATSTVLAAATAPPATTDPTATSASAIALQLQALEQACNFGDPLSNAVRKANRGNRRRDHSRPGGGKGSARGG
jgi:hypothetical protein